MSYFVDDFQLAIDDFTAALSELADAIAGSICHGCHAKDSHNCAECSGRGFHRKPYKPCVAQIGTHRV